MSYLRTIMKRRIDVTIYDPDIEDDHLCGEEEGFVEEWNDWSREEDNIEDVVVVANDLFKQRIQELEFPQLQQDSPAEEAETESNVWDDGSEDVNPFGGGNPGFHDDHYDNPLASMPIYDTDIEDVIEEEEGFVGKGRFGGEEDNIEDVVVVANDLCS
ncbi:hypothetical protein Tco_0168147 [Tanacetum coccineum]